MGPNFISLTIQANSTKLVEAPDISNIPSEYHEFADVFSKTKAKVLASYYLYNLQINLEGAQPQVGPIYSLSASKQEALKEFIKKNLNMSFIRLTSFPHSIPVLFVKKDSLLCLYVVFYSLNCIFKKDYYLFSFISNLLDSPCKA